jgi:hypothetical protein
MRHRAFTLLEVVIATGVFAIGVVGIIALLPALGREMAMAEEQQAAHGLPDAIRLELRRLAERGGFDALAARIPLENSPLADGLALHAPRSGVFVQSAEYLPPDAGRLPDEERHFLIEAWRFGSAPLAFVTGGAALPLHVRVSWPYRIAGSPNPVAAGERRSVSFNLAVAR